MNGHSETRLPNRKDPESKELHLPPLSSWSLRTIHSIGTSRDGSNKKFRGTFTDVPKGVYSEGDETPGACGKSPHREGTPQGQTENTTWTRKGHGRSLSGSLRVRVRFGGRHSGSFTIKNIEVH